MQRLEDEMSRGGKEEDDEIGLLINRYAGRSNFEVETRGRVSSLSPRRV